MVVAGKDEEVLFNRYRVSVRENEKVLGMDDQQSYTAALMC